MKIKKITSTWHAGRRVAAVAIGLSLIGSLVFIAPLRFARSLNVEDLDLTPPQAPLNFTAESRDQMVHLEWTSFDPSDVSRYKIYVSAASQDLEPVYTTDDWYDVSGLQNGVLYTFTVTAQDSSENESTPSNTIATTPSQIVTVTQKKYSVQGWLPTNSDIQDASEAFYNNRDLYEVISPFWFNAEADGTLSAKGGARDQNLIAQSHASGIKVLPTITNNFSLDKTNIILASPTSILHHIDVIMQEVMDNNYDGIDIDYENVAVDRKDAFTFFTNNLAHQLHENGKLLSITSQPKLNANYAWNGPGAMDWEAFAANIDYLRLMLYDYSRANTAPGPIAPKEWIRQALAYAKTIVDPAKIIAGIPFYGYDWALDANGETSGLVWDGVQNTKSKYALTMGWDEEAGEGFYTYTDETGPRQAYYQDARSIEEKLKVITEADVAGICIWRLGSEDPANFDVIRKYLGKHLVLESPAKIRVIPKNKSIKLQWTPNTNTEGVTYNVYAGPSAEQLTKIANTSENSYIIPNLVNGQGYTLRVTAQSATDQESAPTNLIVAAPTDLVTAVPVSDLAAQNVQPGSTDLTWTLDSNRDFVGNIKGYELRYDTKAITNQSWSAARELPKQTYITTDNRVTTTVTGLTPGNQYYFAIKTIDETDHRSAISNVVTIRTTDITPPNTPTDLRVMGAHGNAQLSWNGVMDPDLVGYKLYYGESPDSLSPIFVGMNTFYDLEFLTGDRVYYFRVTALDTAGNESAAVTTKTYIAK